MNNTALITGASGGIGRELAIIHAQSGGDLVLVARSGDKLGQLKDELESAHSVEVLVIAKDLTEVNATDAIFSQLAEQGIVVEFLINNAGFGGHGKFHEREWQQDLEMIQLNIVALTALTRHFLPGMVERNQGRIMNVSSTASLLPGPLQAVYFATKAYVTSFSNALAEELSDTGVTVTALLPGATETGFAETSGMQKTSLFSQTATARSVAQDGYAAMMEGKLNQLSGLTLGQRLMLASIPFTPKKILLGQIRKMQEVEK